MIVTTVSGSKYQIGLDTKTWKRIATGPESGHIRTDSGTFHGVPKPRIGQRLTLIGPPLNPKADARIIQTSPVIHIEEQ